jgi:glucose/arabinose dehydrogenase
MSVIAANLEVPWGIAFLPGGDALFTERDSGRLLRMDSAGNIEEVQTLPTRGYGEGGSLGLAVSPNYREDGYVYAYYTTNIDNRVVRFRLGEEPHPILTGIPFKTPTTTAAGSPSARTACSTSPRATPATPPTPRTVAL